MIYQEIDPSIFGDLQRRWNISSAFLIADTKTSKIYRITQHDGSIAIIKELLPKGIHELIGADYLRWADGNGAVRIIDQHEKCLLLADAGEMTLTEFWRIRGEELAADRVVDLIEKLHSNCSSKIPRTLTPLERHFRSLLESEGNGDASVTGALIFARGIARDLLSMPSEECPLHGDLHHDNILHSEEFGWVAIDPQGLIGNPIYDCTNIFGNPEGEDDVIVNEQRAHYLSTRFAALFRCEPETVLRFAVAHAGLSLSWHLEDKSRIEAKSDAAQRLLFIQLGQQMLNQGI